MRALEKSANERSLSCPRRADSGPQWARQACCQPTCLCTDPSHRFQLPRRLRTTLVDLERALRLEGNVHSADDWHSVLEPVAVRYRDANIRPYGGRDAARPSRATRHVCIPTVDRGNERPFWKSRGNRSRGSLTNHEKLSKKGTVLARPRVGSVPSLASFAWKSRAGTDPSALVPRFACVSPRFLREFGLSFRS